MKKRLQTLFRATLTYGFSFAVLASPSVFALPSAESSLVSGNLADTDRQVSVNTLNLALNEVDPGNISRQGADQLGVIAFEHNSARLNASAEQTLADIARSLDKKAPTDLVVEVAQPLSVIVDSAVKGAESAPSESPSIETEAGAIAAKRATDISALDRAHNIRAFLTSKGVRVNKMTVQQDVDRDSNGPVSELETSRHAEDAARESANEQRVYIMIKDIQTAKQLSTR